MARRRGDRSAADLVGAVGCCGALETLEARVLLSTRLWDGGPDHGGTDFHNPVNWVGDVLPGPTDDAVIPNEPGTPVITITQSVTLNSLTSVEAISHGANASVTLAAHSEFDGGYSLAGQLHLDNGAAATLGASMSIHGGSVYGGFLDANDWIVDVTTVGFFYNGVTLSGTVMVSDAHLVIAGGLTLSNAVVEAVDAVSEVIFAGGTQAVGGAGSFQLTGSGGSMSADSDAVVTLGAGVEVTGRGAITHGLLFGGAGHFINNGSIRANSSGGVLALAPNTLVNNGAIVSVDGGILLLSGVALSNFGTFGFGSGDMQVQSGTGFINEPGGVFSFDSSGDIICSGNGTSFLNEGEYEYNTPTGVHGFYGIHSFTNDTGGLVNVNAGETYINAEAGGIDLLGVINVEAAAFLTLSGATHEAGSAITGGGAALFRTVTPSYGTVQTISGAATWSVTDVQVDGEMAVTGDGDLTVMSAEATWDTSSTDGIGLLIVGGAMAFGLFGSAMGRLVENHGVLTTSQDVSLTSVDNFGTFTDSAGTLSFINFTNEAGAVFNYDSLNNIIGEGGSLINDGDFYKTSSTLGAIIGAISIVNSDTGVMHAEGGEFRWAGSGPHTNLGPILVPAFGAITFYASTSFGPEGLITGAGYVEFFNGTYVITNQLQNGASVTIGACDITFNGDRVFPSVVNIYNTHLSGTGDLTFAGGMTASSNSFTGSGRIIIPASASATLEFENTLYFLAKAVNNFGTLIASNIWWMRSAVVTNEPGAVFNLLTDSINGDAGFDASSIVNEGTFNKAQASDQVFTGPINLSNAASGTMNLTAGSLSLDAAVSSSNLGTIVVAPGVTLNFGSSPAEVLGNTLTGGTWDLAGTMTLPAAASITTNAASVTLRGPGNQFPALQLLDTNSGTLRLFDGRVFDFLPAGDLFTNTGTLIKAGTGSATIDAAVTLDNPGTVHSVGGSLTVAGPIVQIVGGALTGGQWLVDDGAVLDLTGAFVTVNNANVTLAGTAAFTLFAHLTTNNGSLTLADGHAFDFNPVGGAFQNPGSFTVANDLNVTVPLGVAFNNTGNSVHVQAGSVLRLNGGGSHTGDFDIAAGGSVVFDSSNTFSSTAAITGAGSFEFASGTSVINGAVNIDGTALFTGTNESFGSTFHAGAIVINSVSVVTFEGATDAASLQDDGTLAMVGPAGTLAIFGDSTVAGVVTLSGGAAVTFGGTTTFTGTASVVGSGLIINNGTLIRTGAGTTTFEAGVTLDNPGMVEVFSGTLALNGPVVQVQGNTLAAGTWCGTDPGTLSIAGANITTNNAFVMLSGPNSIFTAINGLATNNGWFTIANGRTFTAATLTNSAGGILAVGPGSTFTVTGVLNNDGIVSLPGGTLRALGGGTQTGSFQLAGGTAEFAGSHTFTASSSITGTGTVIFSGGTSILNGTININGTVRFDGNNETFNGSYAATATVVGAASTVTFNAAASTGALSLAGGTLIAGTTASLSAASVSNGGAITLGLRTLAVTGSYTQTGAGTLSAAIASGTSYGRVTAGGAVSLGGTLALTALNGYTPGQGDNFNMLTGATVSGSFATVNQPPPPAHKQWAMRPNGQLVFTWLGDADLDGAVTPADVATFVNVWFTSLLHGTLAGDFDHNGAVEPADVAAFVGEWFYAVTH